LDDSNVFIPQRTLWIIKWQIALSKLVRSKLLSSAMIFYIPIIIFGFILEWYYNYKILRLSIHISLLWLAIAPAVIETAFNHIDKFFINHRHIFNNQSEWRSIYESEITRIQSYRYLIFGVPWALCTSLAVYFSLCSDPPLFIKLWYIISYFILFLISSIGFYGVFAMVAMIKNICRADIIFNPFHPDKFGGISDFGNFVVKIAFYFSSGSLLLPLAFDIVSHFRLSSEFLSYSIYALTISFILVMLFSFIIPIIEIKQLIDPKKNKLILNSRSKLDRMISDLANKSEFDSKGLSDLAVYYMLVYSKLTETKNYPYDIKVLLELSSSLIIPVGVAVLQILTH
jgi:hypothetical protein